MIQLSGQNVMSKVVIRPARARKPAAVTDISGYGHGRYRSPKSF